MRMAPKVLAAFLVVCALATGAARAATIYVNGAATGSNNGSSWANAYTSLQSGLAAAVSRTDPVDAAPTGPRHDDRTSVRLKNRVGVLGGVTARRPCAPSGDPAPRYYSSGDIERRILARNSSMS